MSSRKNIDKLYQRKFQGAEVEPPEEVWQNIASRLPDKKQKKRVIPLWIRYAGAAAVLLLLVNLGGEWFSSSPSNSVTYDSVPYDSLTNDAVTRQEIYQKIQLSSSGFEETMSQVGRELQEKEASEANTKFQETQVALQSSSGLIGKDQHSSVVSAEGSETGVAGVEPTENRVAIDQDPGNSSSAEMFQGSGIAQRPGTSSETREETAVAEASEENAIARQLQEDFLTSKEDIAEQTGGRISISTRLAPVFYEHVGRENGMSAANAGGASGEVSLSYGINLAYQVSDRLKVRSGINKLDLSYSTPGVPMASVMESPVTSDADPALMSRQVEGDLRQQMDFIEVPMELEYRLMDRRIGLNLIAGGSTLFLNRNNLSMDTGFRTTDLGQAKELDELSFSANMGLGLDYQLAPDLRVSLEPMFKYQLNSNESGVRPYYMAIYSGFSLSF